MVKKTILATVLVMVLALAFSVVAVFAQDEDANLKRLIVRNNSDSFLSIVLNSVDGNRTFVLWTPAGEERVFTIPTGTYNRTTFACNKSDTGVLDFSRQTRLVLPSCFGVPANWGEPTLEKITLNDTRSGGDWTYGFD
jgi:hypothetical protein